MIDIFAEDRAHEDFLRAMIGRLGRQEHRDIQTRVRSARGGHGKALNELCLYQRGVLHGLTGMTMPHLLVVAIDANCESFARKTGEIRERLDQEFRERAILACPDPYVERWYLADPQALHDVVGVTPALARTKCERAYYKDILSRTIVRGGYPVTLGGIEFARDIVEAMDLHRAGRSVRSLGHFVTDTVSQLRLWNE